MNKILENALNRKSIKALILDLDGVVTQTAKLHANAWKHMFDDYLLQRGKQDKKEYEPLSIPLDYRQYIDGIPRYDGVRNFLKTRSISLPEGSPQDEPGKETVAGLGNLKNQYFLELVKQGGAEVYTDTISWLEQQRRLGRQTAIISASKNCQAILRGAGIENLFDVRVDGVVAEELGLKGKPDPAIFLEAARKLRVLPQQAAIFEDALAGVKAGKAGNFALVVGVNRGNAANTLLHNGADLVISNFTDNRMETTIHRTEAQELPSALENNLLKEKLNGKQPAVFLDYDGCLTPIVKDPDQAILSDEMRNVLRQLADVCKVAIVSGRDRQNVKQLVQLDNVYFAGSHGFDISGPGGMHTEPGGASAALPALDASAKVLREKLQSIKGTLVERKRYAIAVHYRNVADENVEQVKQITEEVIAQHPELKKGLGKMVIELKPNLDWHKGKAVLWLMEALELNEQVTMPLYIGDDITDEDAFATLQDRGITILVGEHDEKTAATYRLKDVDEVKQFLDQLLHTLTYHG
ncbi:trehalose-phosphatase [Pontibacter vulgaris]|uniref:trehalose-phosphatase n=1 Tax=Pontibacter vulgaris TaxID=2905679 RepID=UPI001FA6EF0A|nr:trehalose-phosphatase [Pontibacter vulgaris]